MQSNSEDTSEPNSLRQSELLVVISKVEEDDSVRLGLAGRMTANGIGDLRRAVEDGRRRRKLLVLDLTEVTLLDRVSAEFLTSLSSHHVRFENCPLYLLPWITGAKQA
ncbi:MAG: hypothetical protein ABI811_23535 [Acidobacteriota bacterium]